MISAIRKPFKRDYRGRGLSRASRYALRGHTFTAPWPDNNGDEYHRASKT